MSMQQPSRPGRTVATTGTSVPEPRAARDLSELLFGGWPFGEFGWPFRELGARAAAMIPVEEVVENDQVVVRAELPGVDPEKDIEVSVQDDVLTIRAERREIAEDKAGRGYRSEFRYGRFLRQIRLPKDTSTEVISASYRDGILEVRFPAPMESGARSRRIQVERG